MKNNKPEIRFKGFNEEWEEKIIAELGDIFTGFTPATCDNSNYGGSYFFVSPADIQENRYIEATNTTLSTKGFNIGRIIKEGSTLFVCIGSTIGKIAQTKRKVATNQQINAVTPNLNFDNDFIFSLLEHESKDIKQLAATQAVPIINKTRFSNVLIACTSNVEEQTKIGTFFKHLDGLIALHQQQYDKQVIVKKAMLEKMFPKNGATVPEIRFKGFTGDWEEKTLGEVGELKNGMNFGKEAMGHGYPFVNLQNVFGRNIVDNRNLGLAVSTENQRKDYCLKKGDILFIRSSVKPEGVGEAALVPEDFENTTYSGFIIRFRSNIEMSDNFKRFVFSTSNIRSQILSNATSSANTNINQESLKKINLIFPSIAEQEKIGSYFQKLDNLLSLHKGELVKLKNIKKALLEKMFV